MHNSNVVRWFPRTSLDRWEGELGDADTASSANPHWCAAAKTTNVLGKSGVFLAYAHNGGLVIFIGSDNWFAFAPTQSLTDAIVNELNQVFTPDNLPCAVALATSTPTATPRPIHSPTPTGNNVPLVSSHADRNRSRQRSWYDHADVFHQVSRTWLWSRRSSTPSSFCFTTGTC